MLAGDEARRLGAALAAVAELEGLRELADIRARLRERRRRAEIRVGYGGEMSAFCVKEETRKGKRCSVYLGDCKKVGWGRRWGFG